RTGQALRDQPGLALEVAGVRQRDEGRGRQLRAGRPRVTRAGHGRRMAASRPAVAGDRRDHGHCHPICARGPEGREDGARRGAGPHRAVARQEVTRTLASQERRFALALLLPALLVLVLTTTAPLVYLVWN